VSNKITGVTAVRLNAASYRPTRLVTYGGWVAANSRVPANGTNAPGTSTSQALMYR